MRAPLSWLREYADLPDVPATDVAAALIRAGLEVETVHAYGGDVRGVVVGAVLTIEELTGFRKPIRYCTVDVGGAERGIVCGATNFAVGDRVPVALPGAMLPGGFAIGARQTYGRTSDGMICSARELGVGEDSDGILVLPPPTPLGADAVDLLHVRDDVLDIAVTPDRGYCFSMRGLAREAATAFGVAFRDPALVHGGAPDGAGHPVRVEDPAGCDRYVAYGLAGLDPAARTPLEMQRRLTLAGMRPISAAVDVTNYVLLDVGQPLHAFDRARVAGSIVVRRAAPGERLVTLDGQDRRLDPEDLVIADDSGAIAIAGVMGGASTEVTAATTELVVESARFDPVSVARSARRHKLPSEASRRFERVVDPELAPAAAVLAARLLGSIAGARPAGVTSVGSPPARPVIAMAAGLPARVAGYPIPPAAVVGRLADVGCTVADPVADPLSVEPPSWRPDLAEPIDLVEEVVRLEGYDNVPEVLPPAPPGRGLTLGQRRRRAVSRAVAAAGYVEVLTYPFLGDGALDALGLEPADPRRITLSLVNPLAEDAAALRTTLLPGLLGALARNLARGAADLALYEEGLVFLPDPDPAARVAPAVPVDARPTADLLAALDAALPDQPRRLAAVLAGAREAPGWWGQGRSVSWADAVEVARTAAGAVALTLAASPARVAPWHPGRCAQLQVGDTVVGHAGELHPGVIAALELPARTCAMELDLDLLLAAAPAVVSAPPISTYPVATSDVALVVGPGVPAARVEAALREGAGPLLESIRLFDDYRGASVGAGARSLAYALRLRAPDRTLTVEEVNAARDAAVAAAGRLTGATLRGA